MVRISVLDPNEPGKKFDHGYDVNTHPKFIRDRLAGFGLIRTEMDSGVAGGAPGSSAPYVATNIQAQMQIGEIVG